MRRREQPAEIRAELVAKLRAVAARPYGAHWGPVADELAAGRPADVPPFVHADLYRRFPRAPRVRVSPDGSARAVRP